MYAVRRKLIHWNHLQRPLDQLTPATAKRQEALNAVGNELLHQGQPNALHATNSNIRKNE
jgi:hypothetical protein